jgi:hypothetical protein
MAAAVEHGDSVTAMIRFDQAPARTISMDESTDKEGLFLRSPKAAIVEMLRRQRLVFRFTPFNSAPQETLFDLTGLGSVAPEMMAACGWDPERDKARAEDERRQHEQAKAAAGQRAREVRAEAEREATDTMGKILASNVAMLESTESARRQSGVQNIGNMAAHHHLVGPLAVIATRALVVALQDPDGNVRSSAALVLGWIGSEAAEALPALEKAAADPNCGCEAFAKASIKAIRKE